MNSDSRTEPEPVRVLLADGRILMRRALRHLIEARATFRVVAEAATVDEIVEHTGEGAIDVIAMDSSVPGLDETDTLPWLNGSDAPGTVIIARHHGVADLHRALHFGANGYVTKDDDPGILYLALQAAATERSFLSPRVTRVVLESVATPETEHPARATADMDERSPARTTHDARE